MRDLCSAYAHEDPLKDKYGLSWQVVPAMMGEVFADPSSERSERVMTAMLRMKKLDIAAPMKAYEGR